MALLAPKVIAQVNARSTGEVGVMSWEWIMRADGQVFYRLAKVDGRRERNEWTLATQLRSSRRLYALRGDQAKATAALDVPSSASTGTGAEPGSYLAGSQL